MDPVSGSFRSLFLYDLSDEIRLDQVRAVLGSAPPGRDLTFRHFAPEYVRFERPPVVEIRPSLTIPGAEARHCRVNYYDYGVVSVEFELPFALPWEDLAGACARWMTEPETERQAAAVVNAARERVRAALVKPYDYQISEDYYILQVGPVRNADGRVLAASELTGLYAADIARMVRGESLALSKEEQAEVLQSRMSYYPNDLLVVGWTAAFIYDTVEGAVPTVQLLEYANSQLLEFRHYDHVLSLLLAQVYDSLNTGTGFFARWRKAREAERLSAMRLDVRELTERVDNSIKFLSDTFSARVYRLAAMRIGVPDYRKLVDEKLSMTGELYQLMMDSFHQGRAFALELMVVIILVIELVYLFRGKR